MRAGELRERVAFERRGEADDGAGNVEADWQQVGGAVAARIKFETYGETVTAQRLEGRQPARIMVRASAATRMVTTDWRIRDARSGRTFNITAVTPGERRDQIDFLCVAGGADG